jgi:hypothetical protein
MIDSSYNSCLFVSLLPARMVSALVVYHSETPVPCYHRDLSFPFDAALSATNDLGGREEAITVKASYLACYKPQLEEADQKSHFLV